MLQYLCNGAPTKGRGAKGSLVVTDNTNCTLDVRLVYRVNICGVLLCVIDVIANSQQRSLTKLKIYIFRIVYKEKKANDSSNVYVKYHVKRENKATPLHFFYKKIYAIVATRFTWLLFVAESILDKCNAFW